LGWLAAHSGLLDLAGGGNFLWANRAGRRDC